MGFARFVGCRKRPSIVMLTPTVRQPGSNRETWPVHTGRPIPSPPLLDHWALGPGPDLLLPVARRHPAICTTCKYPRLSPTRKSDENAVTRKSHRRSIEPANTELNFRKTCPEAKKLIRSSSVRLVESFPSAVHLQVVYIGINSVRKHF